MEKKKRQIWNKTRKKQIEKIVKNNEFKGMVALTSGITVAALGIGSIVGGFIVLKVALLGLGSVYLSVKGIVYLTKRD